MELVQKFNEGGVFMYFIFAFAVFTFALIIERYFTLYRKTNEPTATFRNQILNFISTGDFNSAIRYTETANTTENASICRIAKVGCTLRAQGAGDEEIQARMDEALSSEITTIDRNTGFLGMFGNVSTLLGLLGTITGMIHSFAAVANANPADRATMLSRGISEAMNCTAFGLIVAIPALVAYAFYQNKTDKVITKITGMTSEIYHDLMFLASKRPTQTANANTTRNDAHPMN